MSKYSLVNTITRNVTALFICAVLFASPLYAETLIPISVKSGTNLIHLARDFCFDRSAWEKIAKLNNIKPPYDIYQNGSIDIPLSLLITEDLQVQVASFHGKVRIVDADGNSKAVTDNTTFTTGESIITDSDSFAHLILPDNRYTRVAPDSTFRINYLFRLTDDSIKADFSLDKGRITHNIKKKLKFNELFQTRTPVSLTGVRGTEFRIKLLDEKTNFVETLSGKVAVASEGKTVLVPKGQGIEVVDGKEPAPPRMLPATPELPSLKPVYRTLPISFLASSHPSADYIRIRMCLDKEGTNTFLEMHVKPQEKFVIPTLADGTYYTFATAIDTDGFESLPSPSFEVKVRTIPSAPIISAPDNGLVTFDKQVSSDWLKSEHIENYKIQLASDSEFNTLIDEQLSSEAEFLTAELDPGKYFLRVQGIAPDGFETLFSAPIAWSISNQPSLDKMDLSADKGISLQWSPMEEKGTYDLQISRDADFKNIIVEESGLEEATYKSDKKLYPGEYHVRIRGVLENGTPSQWTPAQILTIEKGPLGIVGIISLIGLILIIAL